MNNNCACRVRYHTGAHAQWHTRITWIRVHTRATWVAGGECSVRGLRTGLSVENCCLVGSATGNTGGSRPHTPKPGAKATQQHGTHEHGFIKLTMPPGLACSCKWRKDNSTRWWWPAPGQSYSYNQSLPLVVVFSCVAPLTMSGAALSPDLWLKQGMDAGHTYFYNPSTQVCDPRRGAGWRGTDRASGVPMGESC